MKHTIVVAFAVLVASAPAAAQTPFSKPESAVNYRRAAFYVMNNHMGRINAVLKGRTTYDKEGVIRSAEIVEYLGKLPYEAFIPGSDLLESKAKPNIWKEEAKFKQLAVDMQAETVKLTAAARSGNLDSIRNQFQATAKACDACHDNYREK